MKPFGVDAHVTKPVPPVLTWEEMEAGLGGQLPLPGVAEGPTNAERVFIALARSWAKQFTEVPENRGPSRDLDELALSALALANDYGSQFTIVAQRQVAANIELTHRRGSGGWLDRMTWSLMQMCSLETSKDCWQIQELVANLNHHNSAIRIWMMEIAWVIRGRLPRERVLPILLENVASTLAGVGMAWGLAAALYEERTVFDDAAALWLPGNNFDQQYIERAKKLKDQTFACQAELWKLEAKLYQRLCHFVFENGNQERITQAHGSLSITDEDLGRKVREVAASLNYSPEALIEFARAAAEHERWSVLPNFGPHPKVIAEKELEESDLAGWPDWINPLIGPGCRLENLEWPDGTITVQILSPRGRVLAASRIPP